VRWRALTRMLAKRHSKSQAVVESNTSSRVWAEVWAGKFFQKPEMTTVGTVDDSVFRRILYRVASRRQSCGSRMKPTW